MGNASSNQTDRTETKYVLESTNSKKTTYADGEFKVYYYLTPLTKNTNNPKPNITMEFNLVYTEIIWDTNTDTGTNTIKLPLACLGSFTSLSSYNPYGSSLIAVGINWGTSLTI